MHVSLYSRPLNYIAQEELAHRVYWRHLFDNDRALLLKALVYTFVAKKVQVQKAVADVKF